MTDAANTPAEPATLLDRLRAAGFDEETARARIVDGGVRVAGETVTDPDAPAAKPTKWVFGPT